MAHQQKIAIADDRLEQIVEVVRDAARELADRLHLLRLRELRLERLLLGRVDEIKDRLRPSARSGRLGAAIDDLVPAAMDLLGLDWFAGGRAADELGAA
jgi:hypothetical protein